MGDEYLTQISPIPDTAWIGDVLRRIGAANAVGRCLAAKSGDKVETSDGI